MGGPHPSELEPVPLLNLNYDIWFVDEGSTRRFVVKAKVVIKSASTDPGMERRQMWLEDQLLRQERDLLRLSRQLNVLQDFITLHFDSFRDFCYERERVGRFDDALGSASTVYSAEVNATGQHETDANPRGSSPIDLSTTWRFNEQTPSSPSPVLSRGTIAQPKDVQNMQEKSLDWDDEDCPEDQIMRNYRGTVGAYPSQESPQSPPYESVLGRILRSEGSVQTMRREFSPISQISTNASGSADGPKLHWSCGTVTTASNPKLYDHGVVEKYEMDLPSESSDIFYTSAIQGVPNTSSIYDNKVLEYSVKNSKYKEHGQNDSQSPPESPSRKPRRARSPARSCSSHGSTGSAGGNSIQPNGNGNFSSRPTNSQNSKKCRYCGKTFQWSHSVKTHERLHTGDKPYVCKMCGTRFTQNGNLKVHAKTCVGKYAELYKSKNIFVCPLCTEMFNSVEALMDHQRSHDRMQWSDKDKTCRYCGQIFQKRSLLLTHEMTHIQKGGSSEDGGRNEEETAAM